jgi:hypothetical protein
VWKLGATTGEARAGSLIPRAGGAGFVSITYADGAAWLSTYDLDCAVSIEVRSYIKEGRCFDTSFT